MKLKSVGHAQIDYFRAELWDETVVEPAERDGVLWIKSGTNDIRVDERDLRSVQGLHLSPHRFGLYCPPQWEIRWRFGSKTCLEVAERQEANPSQLNLTFEACPMHE